MRTEASLTALLLLAVAAAACGGEGESKAGAAAAPPSTVVAAITPAPPPAAPVTVPDTIDPAEFRPQVTHPLFPLSSLRSLEFSGTERDPQNGKTVKTRTVKRLLHKTDVIAGVVVAVLQVKHYEDGEVVEVTEHYFAEHRDGSVWYFGQRVNDYENGKVVGHEGQWLAGQGNNKPGLYLPANATIGMEFEPERAPGVAEVRSKVVEVDAAVTVPAGQYTGCLKTEEFSTLDNVTEFSFFCPGVGPVRTERASGTSQLVRIS